MLNALPAGNWDGAVTSSLQGIHATTWISALPDSLPLDSLLLDSLPLDSLLLDSLLLDSRLLGLGSSWQGRWRTRWPLGRRQLEALARQCESLGGPLRLQQFIVRSAENLSLFGIVGHGEMVYRDGSAIQRPLLVGHGGDSQRGDEAGLLGNDRPKVKIVDRRGQFQQNLQCAGVEIGHED